MDKNKINYVELTGNLAKDAKNQEIEKEDKIIQATFITVASWNGKYFNSEEDRPAQFTDITFFDKKNIMDLKKGQRVCIKGKLVTIKNKETGYPKLSVLGFSCKKIEKIELFEEDDIANKIELENIFEELHS